MLSVQMQYRQHQSVIVLLRLIHEPHIYYIRYNTDITHIGFYQLRQFFYKVCDTFSKQGWYLSQLSKKKSWWRKFLRKRRISKWFMYFFRKHREIVCNFYVNLCISALLANKQMSRITRSWHKGLSIYQMIL